MCIRDRDDDVDGDDTNIYDHNDDNKKNDVNDDNYASTVYNNYKSDNNPQK